MVSEVDVPFYVYDLASREAIGFSTISTDQMRWDTAFDLNRGIQLVQLKTFIKRNASFVIRPLS